MATAPKKRIGRPPLPPHKRKVRVITLRLSEVDFATIKAASMMDGVTVSAYVWKVLVGALVAVEPAT